MFNPERLRIARQRRGLTIKALANDSGLSLRSLTGYENGELKPSDDAIAELAATLKFPIAFFGLDSIQCPKLDAVNFRAMKRMTASQRDAALAASALAMEFNEFIEQQYTLPAADLPDLEDLQPEAAATALRSAWGLGEHPLGNAIHLLESKGVRVFSLIEEAREVDAFSFWLNGFPFVFLNTTKTAERTRFDAMHELGHLVLHARERVPDRKDAEQEADAFASTMLMPRDDVLANAPAHADFASVIRMKHRYRVSAAAYARRLHGLGLMSDWSYRNISIQLAKHGKTKEPNGTRHDDSRLLAKIFTDLRQLGISRSELARILSISVRDLDALVFGLVLSGLDGKGEGSTSNKDARSRLRLV